MTTAPCLEAVGWAQHAKQLAAWAMRWLVNRRDRWGRYGGRGVFTAETRLEPAHLERHFAASCRSDILGLHSTSKGNTSKWGAVDVDLHKDGEGDPDANLAAALAWAEQAREQGTAAFVEDSNGAGGFHLWCIFEEANATPFVHGFLQALTADWNERGLMEPELFPKQASIEPGGCGNWLRLPGRHHTRNHWSRLHTGERWLVGTEAAQWLLTVEGRGMAPPAKTEQPTQGLKLTVPPSTNGIGHIDPSEGGRPGDDFNQRAEWKDTGILDVAKVDRKTKAGVQYLTRPGKDDGASGTIGFCKNEQSGELFHCFTNNWPPFEQKKSYSKFAVYTFLNHKGDFAAATKALAALGFGEADDGDDSRVTIRFTLNRRTVNVIRI